jgi:hypothetical protein
MRDLFRLIGWMVVDLFQSRAALEAEIWTLPQQINVLRRTAPKRVLFRVFDRLAFVGLYRLFPNICDALAIVKPDTIVRWHRAGFRKSRPRGGRPTVPLEIRKLIREISIANPLSGAPRIHGELLKLGIDIGQTSVAKYMARRRGPPSQGWKTFLSNHADGIAAMDLFVVPTISFRLLYSLLIMGMAAGRFYGLASHRIRLQNGSQISSPKHVAGNKLLNHGKLAQCQSLRGSQSATCRFAADRRARLQVPAFIGVECLHEVFCLSGHEAPLIS